MTKQTHHSGKAAPMRVLVQPGFRLPSGAARKVLPGGISHKCEELELRVPFGDIEARLRPMFYRHECGRPPHPLGTMLRLHFLQLRLNLTCRALEAYAHDCPAVMEYARIEDVADIPDHVTIHRFEQFMMEDKVASDMLAGSVDYLRSAEVLDERFHIFDSTVNHSAKSTKNRQGRRDPEMGQTFKNGAWQQGSKTHVKFTANGAAVATVETAANRHDAPVAREMLDGTEKGVLGDRAYKCAEIDAVLEKNKTLNLLMIRRKAKGGRLTPEQARMNRQLARLRAVCEHGFAFIKHACRYRKIRIWGLKRIQNRHRNYFALWNYHRFGLRAAASLAAS